MKFVTLILTLFLYFAELSDSFSYPTNRPTQASIDEDMESCAPMWGALGACVLHLRVGSNYTAVACAAGAVTYCATRIVQTQDAFYFREKSWVGNHRDMNEDGLNDFDLKQETACADLNKNPITSASGESYNLTQDDILNFPGCYEDNEGLAGNTYELYDHSKECITEDGEDEIRIVTDRNSHGKCIKENECTTIEYTTEQGGHESRAEKLVCAYEVDQLLCAEAVFCSMNIIAAKNWGGDSSSNFNKLMTLEECVNFDNINGKVADGVDDYSVDETRLVQCNDICEIEGGILVKRDDVHDRYDEVCANGEYCTIGYDSSVCIDQDTQQQKEGCDPVSHGASKEVRGYIINPQLYAHCIPRRMATYSADYTAPKIISSYCSNDAIVQDIYNKEVDSFSGRAMRCIDQTIRNLFNGGYEVVTNKRVTGYKCIDDDSSVTTVAECSDGLLSQFQEFAKNIVTVILALSISFIGISVLLGGFNDIKKAAQYAIKFSLVLYFVSGDAWRDSYYDFFTTAGTTLGEISFNSVQYSFDNADTVEVLPNDKSCASGNVEETGIDPDLVGPNQILYNDQEVRYKLWDSFDCRWGMLFGRDSVGTVNLLDLISSGFTSFLIYFIILIFVGPATIFLFILVMLKSMFVVLSSMIIVSLLIFLSPIIIPLALFNNKKVRGIFDQWLKQLIGYSLVPMILMMVLAIFFKSIDYSIYGSESNSIYELVDGEVQIKDDCRVVYLPCIIHKFESGYYGSNKKNIQIIITQFFSKEMAQDLSMAILRLFFVFLVMYLIFSQLCSGLISKILGVNVMNEKIFENLTKASQMGLTTAGKVGLNVGKKGFKAAKYLKDKAGGKGGSYNV
jgi:type IV secretory pathway VirB6-like protein